MTPDNRPDLPPGPPPGVGDVAQVTVLCNGEPRPFYLFDTPLGRRVFEEVVTGKSYPLQPSFGEVRTILDVGANVGAAALYFALNYPHARVLAYEPAPSSYALLVRNTRGLPRVEAFNFGLADEDRRALLYAGRQDSVTNSVHSSPGEPTCDLVSREDVASSASVRAHSRLSASSAAVLVWFLSPAGTPSPRPPLTGSTTALSPARSGAASKLAGS